MTSSFKNKFDTTGGFTLVEMLIVVTVIGILTAIMISITNQQAQRKRATDAVNRTYLEQISQAIESYMAVEGKYPPVSAGKPDQTQATTLKEYELKWPAGMLYNVNAQFTDFDIYIVQSNGSYMKYSSVYGGIRNCTAQSIATVGFCTEIK